MAAPGRGGGGSPASVRAVRSLPPRGPGTGREGPCVQGSALLGSGCPPQQAFGGPDVGTMLPNSALGAAVRGLAGSRAGSRWQTQPAQSVWGRHPTGRLKRKHALSPQVGICSSAVPMSRASRCWCLRSRTSPGFPGQPAARLGSSHLLLQASLAAWGRRALRSSLAAALLLRASQGTASAAEAGIRRRWGVEGDSHGAAMPCLLLQARWRLCEQARLCAGMGAPVVLPAGETAARATVAVLSLLHRGAQSGASASAGSRAQYGCLQQ